MAKRSPKTSKSKSVKAGIEEAIYVDDLAKRDPGLGFKRAKVFHGSTFQDCSVVVVAPTRGNIPIRVVQAWESMIWPMNQRRVKLYAVGHEVGHAYNEMLSWILKEPSISKYRYLMTLEDDNIPPPDAMIRLVETLERGSFDGVSGIYWTKGDFNMPMAYGDPERFRANPADLDFNPRDIRVAVEKGSVMEVNGIAMGCSLYRMSLFHEIPGPWFVSVNDIYPDGAKGMTQDLYFCERAVRRGKKFAVDFRVKVGHLDVNTGIVY